MFHTSPKLTSGRLASLHRVGRLSLLIRGVRFDYFRIADPTWSCRVVARIEMSSAVSSACGAVRPSTQDAARESPTLHTFERHRPNYKSRSTYKTFD